MYLVQLPPPAPALVTVPPVPVTTPSEINASRERERVPAASPRSPPVKREAPELLVPKREAAEPERDSPGMETRHAGYGAPPDQRSPYERPPDDHVRSYRYVFTITKYKFKQLSSISVPY